MINTSIKGNQPLLLNDPQTVWMVESGSLAIFALKVNNGIPEGQRRYLFHVHSGEALFGIAPSNDLELGIIAVAVEPTELRKVATEEWHSLAEPEINEIDGDGALLYSPQSVISLSLEGWIHKLGKVKGLLPPTNIGLAPGTQHVSLLKGQIFQPPNEKVLWVQIQNGNAQWMGYEKLSLTSESGILPLAPQMWLQADSDLELSHQSTLEISEVDTLLAGLAQLHKYFLGSIQLIEQQEAQTALLRFQERQRLNRQVTQETIGKLASVLKPQEQAFLVEGTPLLIAAGAVGKALGVTIQPPRKSEDLSRVKQPLEAIARASRLRLRQVLLRNKWWLRDSGPILAYTRQDNHPIALLPVSSNRYELFNPVAQTRTLVDEKVADTLDPVAYIFYAPLPDGVLKPLNLLRFALKGRFKDLILILVTGVAATLVGMVVPQATAILIDNAIPDGNRGLLIQVGLGLLAAAFGAASFQLAQGLVSMRMETVSDATMQAAVWDRLLKLKTSFFREYSTGDLESRVSAIGEIRRKLSGTTLQTIFTSIFSLLNLGLLLYYSAQLAIVAIIVAIITIAFTIVSGLFLLRKNRPLMELSGEIFGLMVQLINGVSKLRSTGAEERAFAHWGQKYNEQLKLELSTQSVEDSVTLFNTLMPILTSAILFWLAVGLLNQSQVAGVAGLSTGTFLAFSVAFGIFIGGATNLSNTVIEVLEVVTLWKRAQPILEAQPEVDLNKADPDRLSGRLIVDHVTFRYREDGPLTLDNVSIHAEPGEFVALVGPSGCGKSTIFRLLLGFEMPSSGTVYYDGQDLAGLDVSAVRRQLGVVLQTSRINAGSIFESIASGALITLKEAEEAAARSGFADDIKAMPMGMHTVVSEGGSNLSGGQRQRLLISRALALKPRILLFDEATSALDNKTQAIVSESLDKLKVTRIVIAHRLSTIRNADRIYVMQAGRVIEKGNFEELASQGGLFAQLIARQLA